MRAGGIPEYPEFSQTEFEDRWSRARAAMAERGLEALLVETNYRYLSGHVS